MPSLAAAEQACGWIGTILWCVQLVPQVVLNYRRKTTQGTSPLLFISWVVSGACLGIYAIVLNISIPIIVQPHCYGGICALICVQILHYDRKWSPLLAYGAGFATYATVCAGFEVAMVYACRAAEAKHIKGPTMLFGILSDVALAAGFFPQLWEIYKLKEVVGISYLFLAMDSLGAVFSILSLAFKDSSIDIIALIGYVVIIAFEAFIGVLALVLNRRARSHRAQIESTASCADMFGGDVQQQHQAEKQRVIEREEEERERRMREEKTEQVLPQVLPPNEERRMAEKLASSTV